MSKIAEQLLKTLCFFDVLGYPPTLIEWLAAYEQVPSDLMVPTWDEIEREANTLIKEGKVLHERSRVVLPSGENLIKQHEDRTRFMPRKLRRARRVAAWLARLSGVRFVALCNTTAMSHAKDESDLDFFVIAKNGTLWQTRGCAALPFKVLGLRPSNQDERDAVCLSFFLDDAVLNVDDLLLANDDPYFRFWFLHLLPLYDDGIGEVFWEANAPIRSCHPFAQAWISHPQLAIKPKQIRLPVSAKLESLARRIQERALPTSIKTKMNQGNDVVVDAHHLKLHSEDGRLAYKQAYEQRCQSLGLRP